MHMRISKVLLLATVILMDFLVGMEFDLFVPSFPELQSHFQLSPFWVEATLSINFIGFCLSLFFVGSLADRFGRRPVLISGLATFVVGSVLCLVAPHFSYLLVGRFLQGAGIAAPAILSFLLIADTFELKKQQYYMAMLNGVMNISIACAPVIGSYTTLYFHWQGNFALLLIIGLIVLALGLAFVPAKKNAISEEHVGYLQLLQTKPLRTLIIFITWMFVPWWIFVGISPLLYMQDLGVAITHFGYYQGGLALIFAVGSILYGSLMTKFDQKKMLFISNAVFIACILLLGYITAIDCKNPLAITLIFSLFIVGQVVPTTVLFPFALNYIPEAKGRTSAMIQAGRLILSSVGLQLAGHYYTGSFQNVGLILIVTIGMTAYMLYIVMQRGIEKSLLEPKAAAQ